MQQNGAVCRTYQIEKILLSTTERSCAARPFRLTQHPEQTTQNSREKLVFIKSTKVLKSAPLIPEVRKEKSEDFSTEKAHQSWS